MKTLSILGVIVIAAIALLAYTPIGFSLRSNLAMAAAQDQTFTVVNNGSTAYRIDGVNNATLALMRGQTYTFNVTATGHPFYIKTSRTTGSVNQYPNGVTGQGEEGGPVVFVVPPDAPNQLFYQCGVHSAMGGTLNISGTVGVPGPIAADVAWLAPAVPNPVRTDALFQYGLPREAAVDFALYDASGRLVRQLASGDQNAGPHSIRWNGQDESGHPAANGAYFLKLTTGDHTLSGRVIVTH